MTTYNLTKNDTRKFISCSKKGTPKNGMSRTSIYGSYPPRVIKSGVHRISLSEHFTVYCVRKLNGAIEKSHKLIKARKMNRFNKLACPSDVASIGWDQITTETDDIKALDNHWTCIFSLIIEKHAPIVEKRVSDKYCPWVNKEQKNFART